jgi:D-glycero-D-manno-heptose 1,7-bisphosphate phosphatase
LPLTEIRVCYHDDQFGCECRKPLPGLLLQAAEDHAIDLCKSVMIGDRWKDVEAGQRASCKTIWLKQDYLEQEPLLPPDLIAGSLADAVKWIALI